MWKPLALAAALALNWAAADAATLGLRPAEAPRIEATAVTADYDALFDLLSIDSPALTVTLDGPGTPPALDSLSVFGGLDPAFAPATLAIFGPADPVAPVISGELTGVGTDGSVLELLFATTADATALFGPRLLMQVETATPDPLSGFAATNTSAAVAAPVPLPPAAATLLAALAACAAMRGRRAA